MKMEEEQSGKWREEDEGLVPFGVRKGTSCAGKGRDKKH